MAPPQSIPKRLILLLIFYFFYLRLVASLFNAASVTGVDVDANLIKSAVGHLSFIYSRTHPATHAMDNNCGEGVNYFPISAVLDHGHRATPAPHLAEASPAPPMRIRSLKLNSSLSSSAHDWRCKDDSPPDADADAEADAVESKIAAPFPQNVHFVCEDWMLTPTSSTPQYDIILALSVVKWLHLQYLDQGLLSFFHKCGQSLRAQGYLVIELQLWSSYEKAVKPGKSPLLAPNLAELSLRPDDFDDLLAKEGFEVVASSDHLPRKITIYRKLV